MTSTHAKRDELENRATISIVLLFAAIVGTLHTYAMALFAVGTYSMFLYEAYETVLDRAPKINVRLSGSFARAGKFRTHPLKMLTLLMIQGAVGLAVVVYARSQPGGWLRVWSISFGVVAADVFALLTGWALGKRFPRKLAPSTSEKKTVIGTIGACVMAPVFFLFVLWLGEFVTDTHLSTTHKVVLAVMIPIMATTGDLFESKVKRLLGNAKDFGPPGDARLGDHGGFYDRFDSHCHLWVGYGFLELIIHFLV